MKRLVLLFVMATCSLLAQAPAAKLFPACFSPDTLAVVRIDGSQLLDLPLFQDFLATKANDGTPFFHKIQDATGVDLDTVTEVWVAPQQGKDRMVVVLKGDFDAQTIETQVRNIETMQVVQRPGVPLAVLLSNKNNPAKSNLAAVLDKDTLVFGKPELVDGFLAAFLGDGKCPAPTLAPRANAMLKNETILSVLLLKLPPEQIRKNPWLKLFTHAEAQVSLVGQDVVLQIVRAAKPEMREPAAKTIEGVRDLYGMLDEDLQRLKPLQAMLLAGVAVKPDPKRLVVELTLPQDMVEQLLRPKLGLALAWNR